jgi:hypothetical protein
MQNLFILEDAEQLIKQDITGLWVIVKPKVMHEVFKPEGQIRENQVVKAVGGFGCKSGSLSVNGGKVFVEDSNGVQDTFYRNEIMGIAKPHVLKIMNIKEGPSND